MIYDCLLFYTTNRNIGLRWRKVPGLRADKPGLHGEDSDPVEPQGIEGWVSGVEVVFGYGAQGLRFAGGSASSGSPKPVLRRSLTSTKTSVLVLLYKTL